MKQIIKFLDKEEEVELAKCDNCGYIGNRANWKGNAIMTNGEKIPIEGIVPLEDNAWNCDDILPSQFHNDGDGIDGEAFCPICGSTNIY